MMENILEFLSLSDPNIRYVVLGSVLLAASSAIVGSFTLLKKKALVGDAVAHSVLPGICAAFLFSGTKHTLLLIIGAFITGWLALILIDYITSRSKLKKDTAIGLVLSIFFGFGIVLLTFIQHSGNAAQSGLDHFIFGNAASLVGSDLIVFSVLGALLLLIVSLFFKEFSLISFDEQYARAIGFPVGKLELLLSTLTVLAVVTGITAVGVVLMAAMLITPGAAARYWTENLKTMVLLAALFGALSGISGAYISYTAPAMPTGPWMVIVSTGIAACSFFLAPRRGILSRQMQLRRNRRVMLEENILKLFYHLAEKKGGFHKKRTLKELIEERPIPEKKLEKGLNRLKNKRLLQQHNGFWSLTQKGYEQAERVVKLHRLWELYLTRYMHIAPDHVHDDAETIEHIITPELARELEHQLNYPEQDPHHSKIPGVKKQ